MDPFIIDFESLRSFTINIRFELNGGGQLRVILAQLHFNHFSNLSEHIELMLYETHRHEASDVVFRVIGLTNIHIIQLGLYSLLSQFRRLNFLFDLRSDVLQRFI